MAASYTFEDYSGTAPSVSDNPYDGLIEMCDNDPVGGIRIEGGTGTDRLAGQDPGSVRHA